MKKLLPITLIMILLVISTKAQTINSTIVPKPKKEKQDKFFIYLGWNRDNYSKSDIHFNGTNYNFTLHNVVANEKATRFDWYYIDPLQFSTPQYNMRGGYYINDKYSISLGWDHMKYVMATNQTVNVDGVIAGTGTKYDGTYKNTPLKMSPDFLEFEHTDGLNYLNTELRRMDKFGSAFKNYVQFYTLLGAGIGIMFPKTNVTLLQHQRNDQWHISGYGADVLTGIQMKIGKVFFIQGELKGGYINMPNIVTTDDNRNDHAHQYFFFFQKNINFGANIRLKK